VLADDNVLLRAGIAELLRHDGLEVVGEAGTAEELITLVRETRPDVAVVDVRMPPTHTVEGLVAARQIRDEFGSAVGILVLSQYVEARHAVETSLTPREREVLELIAEGRSNRSVATALYLSEKTVESSITRIFDKLGLAEDPAAHRRVRAVLAWLQG
jgi:DNA-binding NarL/FixJ family response regulator